MNTEPFVLPHASASLHRLLDLRRRYLAEEARLQWALAAAENDCEQGWRALRLLRRERQGQLPRARRACDDLSFAVESIERDLFDVRAAIRGCDDEIAALERRAARAREDELRSEVAAGMAADQDLC